MFEYAKKKQTTQSIVRKKDPENTAALPKLTNSSNAVKSQSENSSGFSRDDVSAHYNTNRPAQLQALAYTKENQVPPGQERHLRREPGHVLQQKQKMERTENLSGNLVNSAASPEYIAGTGNSAAAIHEASHLSSKKAVQRVVSVVQLHGPNPFERGAVASPRVHHIIAHSKMESKINSLLVPDQREVKRSFMPNSDSLTIRQLKEISRALHVRNGANEITEHDGEFDIPFARLGTEPVLAGCILTGAGFTNPATTIPQFVNMYNNLKASDAAPGDGGGYWDGLLTAYFEWSPGNFFYGPIERSEPGGVDAAAFDSDAEFFRGKAHTDLLKQHERNLDNAQTSADIKTKLIDMSRDTRDKGPGLVHDPAKWVIANTPALQAGILQLLPPGPRREYFDGHRDKNNFSKGLLYFYMDAHHIFDMIREVADTGTAVAEAQRKCNVPVIFQMEKHPKTSKWLLVDTRTNSKQAIGEGKAKMKLPDVQNFIKPSLDALKALLNL